MASDVIGTTKKGTFTMKKENSSSTKLQQLLFSQLLDEQPAISSEADNDAMASEIPMRQSDASVQVNTATSSASSSPNFLKSAANTASNYPFDELPPIPLTPGRNFKETSVKYQKALLREQGRWAWNIGRLFNTTYKSLCPEDGIRMYFDGILAHAKVKESDKEYLLNRLSEGLDLGVLPPDAPDRIFEAIIWYEDNIGKIPSPYWTHRNGTSYPRMYLAINLYGLLKIEFPFARNRIQKAFGINFPNTVQEFLIQCQRREILKRHTHGKARNNKDKSNTARIGTPDRFKLLTDPEWVITHLNGDERKKLKWRNHIRKALPWINTSGYKEFSLKQNQRHSLSSFS